MEKAKCMFFRLGFKPKLPGIVIQQFFIYGPLRDLFQVNFVLSNPRTKYPPSPPNFITKILTPSCPPSLDVTEAKSMLAVVRAHQHALKACPPSSAFLSQ